MPSWSTIRDTTTCSATSACTVPISSACHAGAMARVPHSLVGYDGAGSTRWRNYSYSGRIRLADSGARAVLTDLSHLDMLDTLAPDLPELRHIVTCGGGDLDFWALTERASDAFAAVDTPMPWRSLAKAGR